jgi:hypothetical protein
MPILHAKTSTVPDGSDTTLILPQTDWNAAHIGTNEHTHSSSDLGGLLTAIALSDATATPGAAKLVISDSDSRVNSWVTPINKQIQLLGSSITASATNGCGMINLEMPTNKNTIRVPAFDKDTVEFGEWWHELPSDYDGGTITYHVIWTHPATTTNFKVAWSLKAMAVGNAVSLDTAYGGAVQVNDEGAVTSYQYTTAESAALTIAGTPLAGKLVNWKLSRVATDGTNDTLAVDAYPIEVCITYTRTV